MQPSKPIRNTPPPPPQENPLRPLFRYPGGKYKRDIINSCVRSRLKKAAYFGKK